MPPEKSAATIQAEREEVRKRIKRERDEELLKKLEQRKRQRESLKQSRKQFETSQRMGEYTVAPTMQTKSAFDLSLAGG